jgi:uncharacterized protein
MNFIQHISRLLFFILLCTASYADKAKDFPAPSDPPRLVNDYAQLLNAEETQLLEIKLNRFNDSTSNEIAVVIMESIGEYEISDYAIELAHRWQIGKEKKDNGVLLLIAKNEHKAFIATGYGVEGVLTDSRCRRIIENDLVPYFRKAEFYKGIDAATQSIIEYTKGEYTAEHTAKKSSPIGAFGIFIIIFIIILIIGWINKNKGNDNNNQRRNRNFRTNPWVSLGPMGGGFGSGGSSGGSGGFGGFGGGGFGGGGAGGDW